GSRARLRLDRGGLHGLALRPSGHVAVGCDRAAPFIAGFFFARTGFPGRPAMPHAVVLWLAKGGRMFKRFVMAALCVALAGTVRAADVQFGTVTLKLDVPSAQCALDPAQASDKRMIDFVTTALGNGGVDLLGVSADCGELRDWRSGKLPFLKHFSQYQVAK